MVVEDAVGSAYNCFAAGSRIPGDADAWRHIVVIARNALGDAQGVLCSLRPRIDGGKGGRQLNVIADSVIQSQIGANSPGILRKETHGRVGERIVWIANALHEYLRNPQPVSLHGREAREGRQAGNGGESQSRGTKRAKVVQAAEVDGEIRVQWHVIEIGADLNGVRSPHPGEVVSDLMALLHAIHKREGLAPEESHARNIDGHIAAARSTREVVAQTTARVLVAELIDLVAADGPGVLP